MLVADCHSSLPHMPRAVSNRPVESFYKIAFFRAENGKFFLVPFFSTFRTTIKEAIEKTFFRRLPTVSDNPTGMRTSLDVGRLPRASRHLLLGDWGADPATQDAEVVELRPPGRGHSFSLKADTPVRTSGRRRGRHRALLGAVPVLSCLPSTTCMRSRCS
jgi:hypothetical protein